MALVQGGPEKILLVTIDSFVGILNFVFSQLSGIAFKAVNF